MAEFIENFDNLDCGECEAIKCKCKRKHRRHRRREKEKKECFSPEPECCFKPKKSTPKLINGNNGTGTVRLAVVPSPPLTQILTVFVSSGDTKASWNITGLLSFTIPSDETLILPGTLTGIFTWQLTRISLLNSITSSLPVVIATASTSFFVSATSSQNILVPIYATDTSLCTVNYILSASITWTTTATTITVPITAAFTVAPFRLFLHECCR